MVCNLAAKFSVHQHVYLCLINQKHFMRYTSEVLVSLDLVSV